MGIYFFTASTTELFQLTVILRRSVELKLNNDVQPLLPMNRETGSEA